MNYAWGWIILLVEQVDEHLGDLAHEGGADGGLAESCEALELER